MSEYRIEHVATVPHGWKVRTVVARRHRVRVAFPPGPRVKGAGMVVEVLHPRGENPCPNPAELVLMGGNPAGGPYDRLSRTEKLAFGRLGLGKKKLQTESDIAKARAEVAQVNRLRNRLPNPGQAASEDQARELAADFKHAASDEYEVYDEPHVPRGNYARLGKFIGIAVKPDLSQSAQVQEISFPGREVVLIAAAPRPLYVIGEQDLTDEEIGVFTQAVASEVLLGEARGISYRATKWHPQIADSYRGKNLVYEHRFGEEGGRKPEVWYSRTMHRLLIRGGEYTVEGLGIRN